MNKLSNLFVFRAFFISSFLFLLACNKKDETETKTTKDFVSTIEISTSDKENDTVVEMITDEDILLQPIDSGIAINQEKTEHTAPSKSVTKELPDKKNDAQPKTEPQKINTPTYVETLVQKTSTQEKNTTSIAVLEKDLAHTDFDDLLKKYVTSTGKVNYTGFLSERTKLQGYLKELKNNEPNASWSRNKKLAYWINMYNANTIELILKYNIPKTIMSINGGKAWDLAIVEVGAKKHSLNQIEHEIIRKQFGDPRIHFACVCAAKSCPKLLNTAYTEANLNTKLDEQTKSFINNPARNQISDGNLKVSELFNWYQTDFGDVNAYIRKYYNDSFKDDKKIEFMPYDWTLNN